MFIHRILLVTICALGLVLSSSQASATVVNFSGSNIDMETVAVGQTGTIEADNFGRAILNSISGSLPELSEITFTYNFDGNLILGDLWAAAEYSFRDNGTRFRGFAFDSNNTGAIAIGRENGAPSTPLVVASAQIDFANNVATTTITNFSSGVADFLSLFGGLVSGSRNLEISYSVSAVPVPAALPLFGAGIGLLAGYSVRRKRKQQKEALAA